MTAYDTFTTISEAKNIKIKSPLLGKIADIITLMNKQRVIEFISVFSLLILCNGVAAQVEDISNIEIKTTKIAGGLYMLEGSGGNENLAGSCNSGTVSVLNDPFTLDSGLKYRV